MFNTLINRTLQALLAISIFVSLANANSNELSFLAIQEHSGSRYLNTCRSLVNGKQDITEITRILDCLAMQVPLSRLGGQWLVLRKSHWKIKGFKGNFTYDLADNFFDPDSKHFLYIKQFNSQSPKKLLKYLRHLEQTIFPSILAGLNDPNRPFSTKHSFGASAYHNAAIHTASTFDWPNKVRRFGGEMITWYNNVENNLPKLLKKYPHFKKVLALDPLGSRNWGKIAEMVKSWELKTLPLDGISVHCDTKCFARQETHFVSGLLMNLSNMDLINAVHNYLPQTVGCVPVKIVKGAAGEKPRYFQLNRIDERRFRPTGGILKRNFHFSRWAQEGKWAVLGRALYIRAQMVDRIPKKHPGRQGENFIVYDVSEAGAQHLAQMGGFGAINGSKFIPDYASQNLSSTINYIRNFGFTGLSKLFADYWIAFSTGDTARYEKIASHPIFDDLGVSELGSYNLKTLGAWLDFYRRKSPDTPYKIYLYDYMLTHGYYDNVIRGINRLPAI